MSPPLRRREWVPLPRVKGRDHYTYGPSTVPAGFYASDPEPRRMLDGSDAALVLNPGDGGLLHPTEVSGRSYGCCRLDGIDGPNRVCAGCGSEVGVEISDCWTEYDVRLLASAVVEAPAVGEAAGGTPAVAEPPAAGEG
ncbi:hypothetical protein ACFYUY_39915 [Kitasatospora sp. NPDC004745]|uniref:hypothetical protein n=1 Tax=Kitasatospora sp. NPDC004745 TaxID=3364019 RepID=UPI0036A31A5F